jgi:hypothetical protein
MLSIREDLCPPYDFKLGMPNDGVSLKLLAAAFILASRLSSLER